MASKSIISAKNGSAKGAGLRIGKLRLENPFVLAPMAAVNCASFRLLCREFGASLVSSPMIVARNLANNPERNLEVLSFNKKEKPISIQLVGSIKDPMKEATEAIDEFADVVDVNLGCPEKKILALHAGSFLVKHPDQAQKVVAKVISSTNKPVTAKIRIGWDDKSINAVEMVKMLEDLGCSAVAIHGRTRKQGYTGKADWGIIAKAREKVNIPVIGNGDIGKPGTALMRLNRKECDLVMIGRAAIANPFIFSRCKALFETGRNIPELTAYEKLSMIKKFISYYLKYENKRKLSELRQHCLWLSSSFGGSKILRKKLSSAKFVSEIASILDNAAASLGKKQNFA